MIKRLICWLVGHKITSWSDGSGETFGFRMTTFENGEIKCVGEDIKWTFILVSFDRTSWNKKKWYDKLRYWILLKVIFPESKLEIREETK